MSKVCDLCGNFEFKPILNFNGRSLFSDLMIRPISLEKEVCIHCGLARNAKSFSSENPNFYKDNYQLTNFSQSEEPIFYLDGREVPRSKAIFEMLSKEIANHKASVSTVLEFGCGDGKLLKLMAEKYDIAHGLEINIDSLEVCKANELVVFDNISKTDLKYDVIYSFTVLEHLESPAEYFHSMKQLLKEDGFLVTIVPASFSKDSYDIFFTDHEFHFHPEHLIKYGVKNNFKTMKCEKGTAWASGILICTQIPSDMKIDEAQCNNPLENESITFWKSVIQLTNSKISKHSGPLAVYGGGQLYTFLLAYTKLGEVESHRLFDDNLKRRVQINYPEKFDLENLENNSLVIFTFSPPKSLLASLNELGHQYLVVTEFKNEF